MSRKKKTVVKIAVGVALAAVVLGAYVYSAREPQPQYREVTASRGDLEVTVVSTGVVQPRNRLEIKPPIAGRIEDVLVQEGALVAKGQILAWMSSTERAALLDAARARGPEEVRRWEELYRATPVLAPIHGTLIARNVEPGQTVTGQDAVLVMSDRLTVKAQVDETDIAQVKLGQKAVVTIDAYPDQPIPATVKEIAYDAKTVSNVTVYEVDVLPDQVPAFVRSGMTCSVTFRVAVQHNVLVLPSAAVRQRDGRPYVLVPADKRDAAPLERTIEMGLTDGRRVEVTGGIEEGDTVLVMDVRVSEERAGGGNPLVGFRRPRASQQQQKK
jgi:macrolide-specific efflux system membrane fusion protein